MSASERQDEEQMPRETGTRQGRTPPTGDPHRGEDPAEDPPPEGRAKQGTYTEHTQIYMPYLGRLENARERPREGRVDAQELRGRERVVFISIYIDISIHTIYNIDMINKTHLRRLENARERPREGRVVHAQERENESESYVYLSI